jgi:hypothetical protein
MFSCPVSLITWPGPTLSVTVPGFSSLPLARVGNAVLQEHREAARRHRENMCMNFAAAAKAHSRGDYYMAKFFKDQV